MSARLTTTVWMKAVAKVSFESTSRIKKLNFSKENRERRSEKHFCLECKVCPAPGQVCDPVTGDCVCPPNTVGDVCENCTKNAWNYHPLKGCVLCDCSEVGAEGPECNPINGQV